MGRAGFLTIPRSLGAVGLGRIPGGRGRAQRARDALGAPHLRGQRDRRRLPGGGLQDRPARAGAAPRSASVWSATQDPHAIRPELPPDGAGHAARRLRPSPSTSDGAGARIGHVHSTTRRSTTARHALSDEWPDEAAFIGSGGSIPVAGSLPDLCWAPNPCSSALGKDDDQIHSPNEKYDVESFHIAAPAAGPASCRRFRPTHDRSLILTRHVAYAINCNAIGLHFSVCRPSASPILCTHLETEGLQTP